MLGAPLFGWGSRQKGWAAAALGTPVWQIKLGLGSELTLGMRRNRHGCIYRFNMRPEDSRKSLLDKPETLL